MPFGDFSPFRPERVKGKHARDFHSLLLNFLCNFQSLIDTKRSTANIFENLQICPDIQKNFFTPRFRQKREA
jgi:hypothetical protein